MRLQRTSKGRRIRRWFLTGLLALTLLVTAGVLGVSGYVAGKLSIPTREALEGSPADLGLRYEDVEFPSRDEDIPLSAWYVHADADNSRCTVVMVHGRNHNRNNLGTNPGHPEPKHLLPIAEELAERGYDLLMMDLRAHGKSGGQRYSLGYWEWRDVLGAVDYLESRPDQDGCVVGMSFSMGAAAMMEAAARDTRIDAVVIDSAFAELRPLLDRHLPQASKLPPLFTPPTLLMGQLLYGMDLDSVRPVEDVARILPRPMLLIHGTGDGYIPSEDSKRLQSAAGGKAELWLAPGSDHVAAYRDHPHEYIQRLTSFLDQAVGG